jgi:hypothetical protein
MNLPLSLAAAFLTGVAYAFAGRDTLEEGVFAGKWMLALSVFHSAAYTPLFLYLTIFYPDWSVMYLFSPPAILEERGLNWLFSLSGLAVSFAAAFIGFAYGRARVLEGGAGRAVAFSAALSAAAVLPELVFHWRWLNVGSMLQFREGSARMLVLSAPGIASAAFPVLAVTGIAFWKRMFARRWGHA